MEEEETNRGDRETLSVAVIEEEVEYDEFGGDRETSSERSAMTVERSLDFGDTRKDRDRIYAVGEFVNSVTRREDDQVYPPPPAGFTAGEPVEFLSPYTRAVGGDVTLDRHRHTTRVKVFAGSRAVTMKACEACLLYTSPSPRDATLSRMPSSA